MRKATLLTIALCGAMLYGCNNTPQEKAEKAMEQTEEKAMDAAVDADKAADKAANNDMEKTVYANMAAANAAVAKIAIPALSNDKAKELCSDLGKSIVERINANTSNDIIETEKDILEDRTDVETAFLEKKISAQDKDHILKYGDDCIAAARETL